MKERTKELLILGACAIGAAVPAAAACQKGAFPIALDIGHYLAAPGATSARGFTEFSYNKALATSVQQALVADGFSGTFLIGESGALMPLDRRPQIARERNAALFISLHHDSVQPQYLQSWMVDGQARQYSDRFHGYSIFVSASTAQAARSLELARDLGTALRAHGLTPSLHHAEQIPHEGRQLLDPTLGIYRFDELRVLRGATMPALLLESGVIVNRDEEQAIRSGAYHPRIIASLVQAVDAYCSQH